MSPPESASDCAPSDCPDMDAHMWSRTSLPEDAWAAAPVAEHNKEWSNQTLRLQDLQKFDSSAWLNVSHGPVNMGSSPALSQESQSTHTLHSVSEPDFALLPPGLDLSFIGEPRWDVSGHVVYPSAPEAYPATMVMSPESSSSGPHTTLCYPVPPPDQSFAYGQQYPMVPVQGPSPYPVLAGFDAHASSRGNLIPRAHGPSDLQSYGPCPPPATVSYAGQGVAPSVSNRNGPSREASHSYGPSVGAVGHIRGSGLSQGLLTPRPDSGSPYRCASQSQTSDSGHEETGHLVDQAQEFEPQAAPVRYKLHSFLPTLTLTLRSYSDASRPHLAQVASAIPVAKPALSRTDFEDSNRYPTSSNPASLTEGDEGRHRNHPLYSKGPEADGLYHCPFKSDPSCQHKATKLKCNYE